MLHLIKHASLQEGALFQPSTIQADFEKAFHNAVEISLPATEVKGCFFHFTQCIWRNCQKHGLQTAYKNDPDIQKMVRRAAMLPLVAPEDIDDVWLNTLAEAPATDNCVNFLDYVTENWVEGVWGRDVWNHHHTTAARTNNNVEGWHHRMNSVAGKSHPNLFEFIRIIQREQTLTDLKISQLQAGGRFPPKRRKYRTQDEKLQRLKEQLQGEQLTLVEFADKASFLLHL
ncbi:uncharacterized protein LOC135463460 [Liolophura sinensis]|uniref:uncharacterized protein LOC135463460 n=1 Tax=Liolophura sinensis TaxID=3198878 RepID=UPI0031585D0E